MENNSENKAVLQNQGICKEQPIAAIFIGCILLVAGMWLWGFLDAASSVKKGMNLWDYHQKKNSMNFISRSGMDFYLEHNTDMGSRQREVQDTLDGLRRLFE